MSKLVAPWIDLYVKQFTFEISANDQFYLFHPAADNTRCVVSSAWTQMVKTAFSKYSPNKTATPPKLLRSSFITVRAPPRTHHPKLASLTSSRRSDSTFVPPMPPRTYSSQLQPL